MPISFNLSANLEIDRGSSLHSVFFKIAVVFVFLRISFLHEVISMVTGVNTYLLLIVGVPALGIMFGSGSLFRTVRYRPALYLLGFVVWMALAIPTSIWRGNSAAVLLSYIRTELPLLFIVGGIARSWKECRLLLGAAALAGVVNVVTGRVFMNMDEATTRLEFFGSIGNANDYAAHLLLVLPFLLFWMVRPKSNALVRAISAIALTYGIVLLLATGSRGGGLALGSSVLMYLFWAPTRQRLLGLLIVPIALLAIISLSNRSALERIASVFTGSKEKATIESQDTREYLLFKSIDFTLEHPIFGVGPGEFGDAEGTASKAAGQHGVWMPTHNTVTQVSSENGLPAALCYLLSMGSSYLMLIRAKRVADKMGNAEMRLAIICTLVSLSGFTLASLFLSLAYTFNAPFLCGMAILLASTVESQVSAPKAASAAPTSNSRSPNAFAPAVPTLSPASSRSPHVRGTRLSAALRMRKS